MHVVDGWLGKLNHKEITKPLAGLTDFMNCHNETFDTFCAHCEESEYS